MYFVEQRVEQYFDEGVRVQTVHLVLALDPRLLVVNLRAPLGQIIEVLWGPPEILHPVRVITIRPIVLFIEDWTE